MVKPAQNTICLWYDRDAEEAARFYAKTFPDSSVGALHRAPGDFPSGKKGDLLTVEFTVMGVPCLGLNGGPAFKHNEAFSFQVATGDQAETDRYWNAIVGNGGQESGLPPRAGRGVPQPVVAAHAKHAVSAERALPATDRATHDHRARRGGRAPGHRRRRAEPRHPGGASAHRRAHRHHRQAAVSLTTPGAGDRGLSVCNSA